MRSRLALLTSALLLACGGPDDTGPDTGAGDSTGSEGSSSAAPEGTSSGAADTTGDAAEIHFTEDVWPLLDASCNCHISPPPAGGPGVSNDLFLSEDPATAYGVLVDQPALQAGGTIDQVEPGSADDSYLYHKLVGTFAAVGGSGTIMPPGAMMSAEDLDTIAAWIDGGALP